MKNQIGVLIQQIQQCVLLLGKIYRMLVIISQQNFGNSSPQENVETFQMRDPTSPIEPGGAIIPQKHILQAKEEEVNAKAYDYRQVSLGRRNVISIDQLAPEDTLYTIREGYLYLGIARSTLDRLRSEGYLTDVRIGKTIRLIYRELEELGVLYSIPKGKR